MAYRSEAGVSPVDEDGGRSCRWNSSGPTRLQIRRVQVAEGSTGSDGAARLSSVTPDAGQLTWLVSEAAQSVLREHALPPPWAVGARPTQTGYGRGGAGHAAPKARAAALMASGANTGPIAGAGSSGSAATTIHVQNFLMAPPVQYAEPVNLGISVQELRGRVAATSQVAPGSAVLGHRGAILADTGASLAGWGLVDGSVVVARRRVGTAGPMVAQVIAVHDADELDRPIILQPSRDGDEEQPSELTDGFEVLTDAGGPGGGDP